MTGEVDLPGDADLAGDVDLLREAAREAGQLALDLHRQGLTVERKADGSPVTNGDLAVDSLLKARLRPARPGYAWLSEETADDLARLDARRVFIVDPIDGTSAYLTGKPWFVVSIAVVEAGRPVAAVIHAPAVGELYEAAADRGARRDGAPIRASAATRLDACRMLAPERTFEPARWTRPWPAMQLGRRNAIAYRMALVAAGEFDAAVSLGWKYDWDLAAGDLIAREAGACVSDAAGRPLAFNSRDSRSFGLICAAPGLHPLILSRTAPIDLPV